MALNIKNTEVERLAREVALLGRTTKTEAIRLALVERKNRIVESGDAARLKRFLETKVWPNLPAGASQPWTREEEDAALGYGEWGEPV